MPMIPWTQQVRGARFGEEPPVEPPVKPGEEPPPRVPFESVGAVSPEEWAKRMRRGGAESFKWTMPWQTEHWEDQPAWSRIAGQIGLGVAGVAGGAALGGYGVPAAASWLSGMAPGLTGAALPFVSHPVLGGIGGAGAGWMGSQMMQPPAAPTGPPGLPGLPPTEPTPTPGQPAVGQTRVNYSPTGVPFLEEWNGTEWMRTTEQLEAGPETQPQVIEAGGQQFWWDPTGGMYGTGGWSIIPTRAEGLTPEQQIGLSEEERAHQMEMLKMQYQLEQQAMTQQAGASREQQAAAAAQQMSQMYAADPHKYWAQLGMGTPGAVARLTGGEVSPGQPFQQGVPLSTPSAQWWGGLLPSEQQQISGGLNWLGVDPADYYSMYQRMIPGLGQRQMGPVWAR